MPLYEYECLQCRRHTEKIQKFSDAEITECPHCGGLLERVISAPAIAFKGSGWFKDLYSSAKPPSASGESKGDGAGSSESAANESSAKPAAGGDGASSTPSSSPAPAAPAPAPAAASTGKS